MNNVWLALITGLTTGGLSCFAVQGGLLTSAVSEQNKLTPKARVSVFLVSKLIAYTFLGGLLGFFGASLVISSKVQGYLQILAGFVMLISVARLLEIHPIFRKLALTPPKFVYRFVRSKRNLGGAFAPLVLGALTVLIPCGVTQAMMLLAISTGSAIWGSLIMGGFVLGTSPVFFGLGIASSKFFQNQKLKYIASAAIFALAVISINTGQVLRGSPQTLQNYTKVLFPKKEEAVLAEATINSEGVQEVEIKVLTKGYKASATKIKSGVPTRITLTTNNTKGCARAFTIPDFDIMKILPENGEEFIEFTPNSRGKLTFTCSMGMYSGYFEVI